MSTASEFGRGKTIFVLAIVIGCFAVLWPKIFYPMLTASISQTQGDNEQAKAIPIRLKRLYLTQSIAGSVCCDVISLKDTNAYEVMTEICTNIIRKEQMVQAEPRKKSGVKVSTASLCRNEIMQTCGVDIIGLLKEDHSISMEYKKSLTQLRSLNTSHCIKMNYGVDVREIGLPRKFKDPENAPSHMRPERPFRPGPDMVHPALRERGRAIPTVNIPRRTIEREARPGPVPGMRPPVGGAGHIPSAPKGGGTMGIIMPMYTIGIVCFFLYTIMKILFKKNPAEPEPPVKPAPIVKDYGLDPEHRKFVMSEEYAEGSDRSMKEAFSKEDRDLGLRRRPSGGKSAARFYEDRRRLGNDKIKYFQMSVACQEPTVIFPTYPSDLETDPETTTPSLTPPTDMPESSTPAAQPGDDDVVNDDINITMPPVSPTLLQEIADTHIQIQSVTNEPESEPEALKDQMVYEKLKDEGSVPYSSLAHLEGDDDEGSIIPTLHDIVHEIVSEAEMIAERIKENAVFPVALEGDTMATSSADDASETTQNEPAILVEEEPKTTPSFVSTEIDDEVVKPESSKRHELSKEVSVCSSADTVVAESATGSETDDVDTAAIEAVVSSLSTAGDSEVAPKESVGDAGEIQKAEVGETELVAESKPESEPAIKDQVVEEPVITSTKIVEQSAPPPAQPSEPGPLSPLAPEQTPDTESEPPHFFDRTIVIPDYEPEAARARKQSQELAREAVAPPLPSAPTEPEAEEPETITIVKQEAVPPEVLTLAEKVAERILEAAKAQFVNIAPKGESMLDELADDNDTAAAAITIEPTPESEPEPIISPQPRLSLDTNLPLPSTNKLEADADDVANPELLLPSDNLDVDTTTKTSSTPKAPATTPEIQVETPHADQTEINRIAEFLEGLNTEPKEAEKLAAVPQEQPEINQNAPIVTLADESKDSFSDSPKASQTPKTKSKLEITPVDDSQVAASSSFGIADICYVTQPLDDSQKGIDKSKIFKSSVEIVSFDESLTVATEPVEKFRKSSEPVNIGLDSKPTETLEEAVKKLRRVVPKDLSELGEGTGPDGEKLKKASRKSSTAQSEDSQKESEIDKYVEKLANMQGSRKSMIEQAMFKSSTSSQGSEPEQQQHADQSSNFHGPGLLDSGQSRELPGEKIDKMKEVEKWATATINDDDSGEKTTDVVDIINDASPTKLDEPIASNEPEPGTDIISVEIVAAPQEIIDKVASLIDQALHDGIKKAVKFLENSGTPTTIPVVESDSSLETVELGIEKLDQVLEELAAEAANNIILSSVPTMELKVEKDETGLLEPMEMEERLDSKAVCDKATFLVRDTNETVQTDNEMLSHAQPIISTTCDNTNNVDSITLKVETGIVSDSAEKVTSLTGVTNVRIAEEPETISTTATAVEASAFESTTTTIPSESSPSETAPVAVESSETVTSSPKEEIVEKAVENAEEQAAENVEEISEQQDEGEESQEPIIAELETIQEEIESLSSELDQMENAALAASATSAEKVIEEGQEKEPTEQEPQKEKVELSEQQVQSETQVQAAEPPQVEEFLKTEVTLPVAAEAVEQNDGITIADTNQSEIQETSGSQQPAQAEESRISQETTNVNEFVNTQVDDLEKPKEISQIDESP
ncbi:hypothetical protein Ocin01_02256 [Orchesella cincta]|uniref:Resistance to inhibitors of cholinesterase protein 3 N-terminal domain-containing protein n=1 Tax=Orchesella cincta TaxID=48709 RepID=A0A1D2NGT2_ORCCI|nr:hypothetical protein Ocin01_02256 [Orchesella cincta]